jgi:amino acid transporter
MKYEEMSYTQLTRIIEKSEKRVTVWFIGLGSIMLIAFLWFMYSPANIILAVLIFVGFLLVYYMQIFIFLRLLKKIRFPDQYNELTKQSIEELKDIQELK